MKTSIIQTPINIPLNKNQQLKGKILQSNQFAGKRPAILTIHGWMSSMVNYPPRLAPMIDQGYLVVLFDLRGHGTTGGDLTKLSPKDHLDDCLAAYDFMVGLENVDHDHISVFGSSYGGYLAALLTEQRPVHHLALNVPAQYPDKIFNLPKLQRSQETTNYRKSHHIPNDNKALKAISKFQGDLLIIEAEHDEVLPAIVMEDYRNAAKVKCSYQLIKNSDHAMTTPAANQARIQTLKKWFKQFVR